MSKTVKIKPAFDPQKSYKWEPSDTFEITGQQFASLYHLLSQEMNTPGGAPLALKVEAHNVIMEMFKNGVENGVINEHAVSEVLDTETEDKIRKIF